MHYTQSDPREPAFRGARPGCWHSWLLEPRMLGIRAGRQARPRQHAEHSPTSIRKCSHLNYWEREGWLLSKSSCQQLGCRGTVPATVLSLGNWKTLLLRFHNKLLVFHFKCWRKRNHFFLQIISTVTICWWCIYVKFSFWSIPLFQPLLEKCSNRIAWLWIGDWPCFSRSAKRVIQGTSM